MSHQEKHSIFNEYAKSQGYKNWQALQFQYCTLLMTDDEFNLFMFEACDLVQEELQKRIAENVKIEPPFEHFSQWIDKESIINPENKIQ